MKNYSFVEYEICKNKIFSVYIHYIQLKAHFFGVKNFERERLVALDINFFVKVVLGSLFIAPINQSARAY